MSIFRLLGIWSVLAIAMIVNGAIREIALVPALGRSTAEATSVLLGIVIILAITRQMLKPLVAASPRSATLIGMSATWVLLTVAFEFTFGHFVEGKSWSELGANYAIWRGHLWPVVLLALAAAPFIWARAQKRA